jgi:FkbM family methyltransferase
MIANQKALELGRQYFRAGDLERAERTVRPWLGADRRDAEGWCLLGLIAQARGKPAEALAHFREAVRLDPACADGHAGLGRVYTAEGQPAMALLSLQEVVRLRPADAGAHYQLGEAYLALGRNEDAVAQYRQAVGLDAGFGEALNALGWALLRWGKADEAAPLLEQALRSLPGHPPACTNLAWACNDLGRYDRALACADVALRGAPDLAEAHNARGIALLGLGRPDEAGPSFARAVQIRPDLADAHDNLGRALRRLGRLAEAVDSFQRAVQLQPQNAKFLAHIAYTLGEQGRWQDSVRAARAALRLDPTIGEAYNDLGLALIELGEPGEAAAVLQEGARVRPDLAETHNNLGWARLRQGRPEEAVGPLTEAVRLRPDFGCAFANLGHAYQRLGRLDEALAGYGTAVRLDPDDAGAFGQLGNVCRELGLIDEALAAYRRCLELNPHDAVMYSNLLLTLHYRAGSGPEAVFEEHRRYAARHAGQLPPPAPHANDRDPERRLRLGYVSGDFRWHVMAFYIEPLLAAHDRARFEVFCYANVETPDATTGRLRTLADHWRDISRLTDEQAAELIRRDGIDLLVDLSGHTGGNRLPLLARKPAPVQATHFGYLETTGLDAIDYRITDAVCDPPGQAERYHSERLARLPEVGWFCVPATDLEPGPLPARAAGHVTFGVTAGFPKISPEAVAAWAQILHAVPAARLAVLAAASPEADERLRADFGRHGIGPGRLTRLERQPRAGYLRLYQGLDVCLDTFPYTGCNTTCDALWMGVPVVCLAGSHGVARQGASPLVHLGLTDLVAATAEAYVAAAVRLAGDLPRLAALRAGLRERMTRSTLTNPERFTRQIEALYRSMWREYCARNPAPGNGVMKPTAAPAPPPAPPAAGARPAPGGKPMATVAEALAAAGRCMQSGDFARAEQLTRYVLQAEPANPSALYALGVACSRLNRPAEAEGCLRRAVEVRPGHADSWNQLGGALLAQGRTAEAVPCFQQAVRLQPDLADGHNNLGNALGRLKDLDGAIACYRQVLRLRPDLAEPHYNLGTALMAKGKTPEAIAAFRETIRIKPDFANALTNLGGLLAAGGEDEEALALYRRVLQLCPDRPEAHANLATSLLEEGRQEEAVARFREALRLNPNHVAALASVAIHGLYPLTDDQVGRIRAMAADPRLAPGDACVLEFGLANLRSRAGAHDEAFEHFRRGNELRRVVFRQFGSAFDPRAHRAAMDRMVRTCDAAYFERVRGSGVDSEVPVFIVGMPRSGTTLVEQILAAHPQVHGAGELRDVMQLAEALPAELGGTAKYPECLAGAPAAALRARAERLLGRFERLGRGARRVVDKMPENYLHLGLIATLFPRARIIHCRRDPMDTCVSCYCSYFRGLPFAWDLSDLGKYHRQYERLMAHWREVLPLQVMDVDYEELVANQEEVSRALVAFLGLDWDDACLAFHENRRAVHTVSTLQVRRPMYSSSVGRWKRYEAHLGPLKAALAGPDDEPAEPPPPASGPAPFPRLRQALSVELPAVEVLDVGAMTEGEDRYAPLVSQGLARVTGFEPNPEELERLRTTRKGPFRYLPHVLGAGGPATFHLTRYPGCSSLYEPDPAVIDLFTSIGAGEGGNFQVVRTERVQTTRLDDVPDCPAPDYVKLDAQGAELDVLRGGAAALAHALVVEVEVEFVALYKGQPLFGDVQSFLRERGFVLHKLIDVAGRAFSPLALGGNPFAAISQVLWADAVFVRDFTALGRLTPPQLLKAATVLHDVYASYDLVNLLLAEYDRRQGTDLVRRYAAAVLNGRPLPTLYLNLKLDP